MMQCFATATILIIVLMILMTEAHELFGLVADYRRLLPPDLPRPVRRLLWRQWAWVAFPVRKAVGLIFWLLISFPLTCQMARQVMTA